MAPATSGDQRFEERGGKETQNLQLDKVFVGHVASLAVEDAQPQTRRDGGVDIEEGLKFTNADADAVYPRLHSQG